MTIDDPRFFTEEEITPKLSAIVKHGGIADRYAFSVDVEWLREPPKRYTFTGSIIGPAPVVMVTTDTNGKETQDFIDNPSRFGTFGAQWVTNFWTLDFQTLDSLRNH
jgi:hypothetical protein